MDRRRSWIIAIVALGAIVLLFAGLPIILQPWGDAVSILRRLAGLAGFLAVFLGTLSSVFERPLIKRFGKPFVKLHHGVTITGLVLITLHPLFNTIHNLSFGLPVLPVISGWGDVLPNAGYAAWSLIAVAAGFAFARNYVKNAWRTIHRLIYLALLVGAAHGLSIGTDLQMLVWRALVILMAAAGIVVFVIKVQRRRKRAQKA